jgi:hypothetical protein
MPRGGKRPGAGAKSGNSNALKTGEFSRRARGLQRAITQWPALMDYVWNLSKGEPARMETAGYVLRYLGDELIRSARAPRGNFRRPNDREVLAHLLRNWTPPTPPKELP